MKVVNMLQEVENLIKNDRPGTNGLLTADTFSVEVRVYSPKHKPRLHTCSQDEFTYVLDGVVDMLADGQVYTLQKGESIHVPVGVEHCTLPHEGASWMLVAKEPHQHRYIKDI